MAYSKEKQEKLVASLTRIGSLVGEKAKDEAGKNIGLGMSLEQTKCLETAQTVRDGLFKVVVMGTFSCGKSTVINALIGTKVLPESPLPCTAILTFIQYGQDEENVTLYMQDRMEDGKLISGEVTTMSVAAFEKEYQYTSEDEKECIETGGVARFAKVKYAVMNCSKPLMEGGVRIIDSPGLEDKAIATDLTMDIAQKAQAIIYVSLERALSVPDKEYIISSFRNCPNNVFFLVNKIDLVKKDERPRVLDKLKQDILPVFTKADGTVDEMLCSKRIFGISALQCLDSRRGMTYDKDLEEDVTLSDEKRKIMLEKSGYLQFEEELEKFLTTDEKCVAQYQYCFHQMASTYAAAESKIQENIAIFEKNRSLSEEQKANCDETIEKIEKSIQITESTFDNCTLKIQNKVSALVSGCIDSIDKTWEADIVELDKKVDFGLLSYVGMALKQINPFDSKEEKARKMEATIQPFTTAVAEYFDQKIDSYFTQNKSVLDATVEECQKALDISAMNTDKLFKELTKEFVGAQGPVANPKEQSWLQNALSLMFSDISASIKTAAGGKTSWVDFIKKAIFNYMWQSVLVAIAGGPGAIIALAIEFMQMKSNKSEQVRQLLNETKNGTLKQMRSVIGKAIEVTNQKVATAMNGEKELKCRDARLRLQDEHNRIEEIIASLSSQEFNLNAEKEIYAYILDQIRNETKDSFAFVMESVLSDTDFNNLK